MPWVIRSAAGNLFMAAATEVPLAFAIEVPALNVRIACRRLAQPLLPGPLDLAPGGGIARCRDKILVQRIPGRAAVVRNQHRPVAAGHDPQRSIRRKGDASEPRIHAVCHPLVESPTIA